MEQNNVPSMIFTPAKPLPEILGDPRSKEEVLQQIYEDPEALLSFNKLNSLEQEILLEFCMGNRSLKITYDPFFQNIFNPSLHPDRLNRFLSAVLKQPVIVRDILPRESTRLTAESSLMIMDILVELQDGSLINVEMQKIGYNFPIERTFCYGSDLLVRQYDRIRASLGKKFTYKDMRPIHIIVLMEKSPGLFQQYSETYMHHSKFQLDSGLPIKNLLNFTYIPLDIFLDMPHNKLTELEAWLYFLSSDNPLHIQRITEKYPFFKELYQDIIAFRYHPRELITMYSESLLIADRNTVNLMIDEMRQQFEEESAKHKAELAEMGAEISQKKAEISQKDAEISQKDAEISQKDAEISQKDAEISQKDTLLSTKDTTIAQKDAEIAEKDAEIARLKAALEKKS